MATNKGSGRRGVAPKPSVKVGGTTVRLGRKSPARGDTGKKGR